MLLDEELLKDAQAIVNTEPGDDEAYVANFVTFQKRWNYLVPTVPVYVPASSDFFIPELKGFDNDVFTGVCQSILYAYFE